MGLDDLLGDRRVLTVADAATGFWVAISA